MIYVKLAAKTMITPQLIEHEQVSGVILATPRLEHDPPDFPRVQFETQPLGAVPSPSFESVSRSSSTNDGQILGRYSLHGIAPRRERRFHGRQRNETRPRQRTHTTSRRLRRITVAIDLEVA